MRLKTHALARGWIALSVAVLTVLPAGAAAAASPAETPTRLPHVVGGYVAGGTRVAAKAPTFGGVRASAVLPDAVDLRSWAPPIGDQGQIGSCVAWSIGYGIMGYWANRTGGSGAPYAPLFLYMRNVAAGGAPSAGLYPGSVLANAQAAGVDTQADYYQGTTNWQTPPTTAQITNATKYKISGWSRLFEGANQGDAAKTSIQQAMASGNPVALGMPVFSDFMNLRTHTLYNPASGSSLGGHMVAAYAYDSQGVTIRNSWGTWWGNNGEAKLSWAFITKMVSAGYTVSGISTPSAPVAVAPTVASLSVTKAVAGTSVTITGAGLAGATGVKFGTDSAAFSPVTAEGVTKLVVTAPAHAAGTVDVTVTNSTGTSEVSAASKFTYIPPAPAITALSPNAVSILGGSTVTVTGTDLTGVTAVKLGTTSVTVKPVSATSMTFVAPARAAGAVAVTANNTWGTSPSTEATQLTYVTPPAAAIAAITPSSGLTTSVTAAVVTGTDFDGATKVTAGGVNIPFKKISGTSLSITMPKHDAGTVKLRITTPGGISAEIANSTFTYRPPPAPAITAVTPNTGLTYVQTPVVLTGVNLANVTKVTANGTSVRYTKISDTSLSLTMPKHDAGQVDLVVTSIGGPSASGSDSRFTYLAPPVPAITALQPSSGSTVTANTVYLNGANFTAASLVTGNGSKLAFVKVSDTQLRVTVPKRAAGAVEIVVTTPGGLSAPSVYTAVAPPVPAVSQLSSSSGLTYVPTTLTLTGTGLGGVTKVTIGGVATPVTKVSDTELRITAPKRAPGVVPIVVTAIGGTSDPVMFTYEAPPVPTITALGAQTGLTTKATTITLTGANLTATSKVTAGTSAVRFVVVSDTQLTLTMPARPAGAVEVKVTTPGGTSSAAVFTYVLP